LQQVKYNSVPGFATLRGLLADAVRRFEDAGVSYGHGTTNATDEAAWILLHALGLPPHELNAHLDEPLDPARVQAARKLVTQRIRTRKPAAYLLNEAWLGPYRFYVDERVIVPRSFIAEWLVTPAKAGAQSPWTPAFAGVTRILDLCTGSGCLAILAALAFPEAKVDAVDLSPDALAVAQRNVRDYGLDERIELVRSDLFTALEGRTYDLVISNPPYVKATSMRTLPREYRREPEMALASGRDGLDHTRAILREAPRFLERKGLLVVEIGRNRKALERAYPRLPFRWPRTSAGPGFVFTLTAESLGHREGA
jgi:ribosomal protein L3 glutamine methyltransferase